MAYFMTVSRTDYSARKARWANPKYDPGVRQFGTKELPLAYPGALVLVGDGGHIEKAVPLLSPKGMLLIENKLFVSCYSEIRVFSPDLKSSSTFLDEKWCNDLHSLRPTTRGIVVAVSGIDAAFEFDLDGQVLWEWWAVDHGFSTSMNGDTWPFDRRADHRMLSYPISMQSTHINAICELGADTFAATLLHRNCMIKIDRSTGAVTTLLEGLGRPHAVRARSPHQVTLADTTNGSILIAEVGNGSGHVLSKLSFNTSWIHDAYLVNDGWLIVDGENSSVLHASIDGKVDRIDTFDPEWCLYEVIPL